MYMYCLGYSVVFGFILGFYVCSEAKDQNTILLLYYCGTVIVRPYLVHPNLSQLFYWHLATVVQMLDSTIHQAPVVQTSDSAIHRINHYPADSIDFRNTYPLDSDLSGG